MYKDNFQENKNFIKSMFTQENSIKKYEDYSVEELK